MATSNTYADRLSKLGAKLDSVEAKISELQQQRDRILGDIEAIVGGTPSPRLTISTARKVKGVKKAANLGAQIKTLLSETGQTAQELAAQIEGTTPSQIGLSLYHLVKRGLALETDNKFFAMPTGVIS